MTKWKIGFSGWGLVLALACGEPGGGSDDSTMGAATADGTNAGGRPGRRPGGPRRGAGDPRGSGTSAGGGGAGGTSATGGGAGAGGDDADASMPGSTASGACTNAGDMAIIGGTSLASLACEGAACAGGRFVGGKAQNVCIAEDAPTLKQLSAGCQKCFDDITSCVPSKCVRLLGGEDGCGVALPEANFAKCAKPPVADAKCTDCNVGTVGLRSSTAAACGDPPLDDGRPRRLLAALCRRPLVDQVTFAW